ncbi:IclR family transcriptional regulator [Aminobacter sp. J44]|uniref:IclR family transcriptional regulator n=1 Tax=Aminobacter sp. J44 TaxID=935262 RepID=UPI00119C41D8|nr:IclR family transcriptional regulator [Aminobacter sp. J44]TWG54016.1 IclR family transcriptional regulator [Aminobacter sp. J44]
MPRATRQPRRIQSIEVGFRLIHVLEAAGGKLSLSKIAELAGMPASKAHLYMASFMQLGLVEQDPTTMRYGLGPYALQLGAAAMRQIDVAQVSRDALNSLQTATGHLVFLSIWSNRGPVIISKVDSTVEVLVSVRVGHVLPLYRAATGRVFLAYKSRAAIQHIEQFETETDQATKERAQQSLDLIRQRQLAFSDSQINIGFASISAPIFDYAGEIAAAVTVLGMKNDINLDPLGPTARLVSAAATSISLRLACPPELLRTDFDATEGLLPINEGRTR